MVKKTSSTYMEVPNKLKVCQQVHLFHVGYIRWGENDQQNIHGSSQSLINSWIANELKPSLVKTERRHHFPNWVNFLCPMVANSYVDLLFHDD